MPETYRVKLSDGREFDVSTEGGPPSEADILANLATQKPPTSQPSQPFVPKTAKEFLDRMGAAAVDVPIGAAKNLGRMVQSIPIPSRFGVTNAAKMADSAYGLPAGASAVAMQPSNSTQTAGGYVGDAALIAATASAEAGAPLLSKAAGYISNPTVGEHAANIARGASEFSGETLNAIKAQLTSGGGPTPEKVASLVVKFGKKAVQAAIIGAGLGGGYGAIRHLF